MSSKSSHSGLKRARKKKVKIWWKIPDLDAIPTNEAREIIDEFTDFEDLSDEKKVDEFLGKIIK